MRGAAEASSRTSGSAVETEMDWARRREGLLGDADGTKREGVGRAVPTPLPPPRQQQQTTLPLIVIVSWQQHGEETRSEASKTHCCLTIAP